MSRSAPIFRRAPNLDSAVVCRQPVVVPPDGPLTGFLIELFVVLPRSHSPGAFTVSTRLRPVHVAFDSQPERSTWSVTDASNSRHAPTFGEGIYEQENHSSEISF